MNQLNRSHFDQLHTPNYAPATIVPVRGAGSRLWDQEGNEYLDFAAGIAVSSLGHCHPKVVSALTEQANKLWHVSNVITNEPALALASRLIEKTFAERVFFANSGGEANEAAFKLARRYAVNKYGAEKDQIIACNNAFHGRTFFTVCVGGQEKYSDGFGPKAGGISHIPYNDVAALEAMISDNTCAVVIEPVQGEGGVTPATQAFMTAARELCTKHNALLVLDEVQTGAGRCGSFFAYEKFGITPDIVTSAKGIGGGFPVAAMLTTAEIAESLEVGTHGSTYGGNPLACTVALAVVDTLFDEDVIADVDEKGEYFRNGLKAINDKYGLFSDVRGLGLLNGAELKPEHEGKSRQILDACRDAGLLILVAGPNVLRFAPALNISVADIDQGLAIFDSALAGL